MEIAFSPCPNDTFVFHAWVHGFVPGAPKLDVTYADIDKTNNWAADGKGPLVQKISYAALPYVLSDYALIPCGGALGRGCGPLVLTQQMEEGPQALSGKRWLCRVNVRRLICCFGYGQPKMYLEGLAKLL